MSNEDVTITTNSSKSQTRPTPKGPQPNNAAQNQDFFSSARRTARAVSPAPVNSLIAAMKTRISEDTDLKNIQVLPYIGKKDGRNLSGVVAYVNTGTVVVLHFIAVAASCELTAREIPVDSSGHQKVSMDTYVSDLYNLETTAFIRKEIMRANPATGNCVFHNAGCSVIRMKHTDPEYVDIASNFANIASDAILDFAAHEKLTPEVLFNVDILKGHQPRAHLSVQPQHVVTLDGLSKRADLSVSVLAQAQSSEGSEPIELTRASGFVNFIYRRPQTTFVHGQQVTSTEYFQPEIVVTEATALTHASTLESILYAFYSMDSLIAEHRWLNLYRDNHATSKNGINPYNLGALNIDLPNVGDPAIDDKIFATGDHAWVENGLYTFAAKFFTKSIGKAIDIPETGPSSRLLGLLRATVVQPGMKDAQLTRAKVARAAVIKAGDNLTGGLFGKYLGSAPLFMSTVERIIIGDYVEDGIRKDINCIDHVSVLNELGEKDPDTAYRLEKTFTDLQVPEIVRLRDRIDVYRIIKGNTLTIYEIGHRLRQTKAASQALARAISEREVGLYIEGVGSVQAQPERGAGYLQGDYGMDTSDVAGFGSGTSAGAGQAYFTPQAW